MTELQQQIEAVRRDALLPATRGMRSILGCRVAFRQMNHCRSRTARTGRARQAEPARSRRPGAAPAPAGVSTSTPIGTAGAAGANALMIERDPNGSRAARRATSGDPEGAAGQGVGISSPRSHRRWPLEARNPAEQVGDSKTCVTAAPDLMPSFNLTPTLWHTTRTWALSSP